MDKLKYKYDTNTLFVLIVISIMCSSILWYNSLVDEKFHYFRDYSLLIGSLLSIFLLFNNIKLNSVFQLSTLDLLLFALILYTISHIERFTFNDEILLKTILYLMFFIAVKSYKNMDKITLPFSIILIFFYWLLSSFGLIEFISNNANFGKGVAYNFSNSGVMGNYLALGYPIILNQYFLCSTKQEGIKKYILLYLLIQTVIVVILTAARASWVAVIVSSSLVSFMHYKPKFDYKKIALGLSSIVFLVLIPIFTNFKMASVLGRLLIYKVSWYVLLDNFFIGYGVGNFASVYNTYQANYFSKIDVFNASEWHIARAADSMRLACNEYLQAFIELGFVGFLLIFCIIVLFLYQFYAHKSREIDTHTGFFASVIGVLVCAVFSYPFQETPICLLFILMAAIISQKTDKAVFTLKTKASITLYSLLIFLSIAVSISLFRIFEYKKTWQKAAIAANKGQFENSQYIALYTVLNTNSSFLYNYGCELSKAGQYEKSIKILDETMKKVIDEKLLCFQGENYYQTKQWDKAETAYIFACNIVPSRFFPKYYLMEFYLKTGNNLEAKQVGQKIVAMPEKIPSIESRQIKSRAKYLVDSLKSVY